MDVLKDCPVCGESWEAKHIPQDVKEKYGADVPHFTLLDGYTNSLGVIIYWQCPFCKTYFDADTEEEYEEIIDE